MRQVSGRGIRQTAKARAALFGSVSLIALAVTGGEAMAQQVYANGDDNAAGIDLNDAATRRTFSVPTGAATQSGAITESVAGSGLEKIGAGTLTISNGANSYTGGTTISAGTLVATQAGVLGTGAITLNGGTLSNSASLTLSNDLGAAAGTTSTIVAGDGTTLTFAPGTYRNAAGSSLRLGAAGSTGTIDFRAAGSALNSSAGPTEILGGIVRASGPNSAVNANSDLTIATGAALELNGFTQVRALQGAGDIRSTSSARLDVFGGGTFSGRIGTVGADALSLSYLGTGTLTLTGRNLYTGGTTIRFGTLVAGAESLGSGDISFGNFGGFTRRLITSGTLSGRSITVQGSGPVVIGAGAGQTARLQLTNFNTDQSGRLEFGQAGVSGTVEFQATTVSVVNPARTLVFAGGTTRDTGGLGRLINALASTTVNAGATLAFGDGGDASVNKGIVNNGALEIGRSDAMSFSGVISGAGSLAQSGAGVTTLLGANSYGGTTTVSAGTLRGGAANRFSNASATTVSTGGTLDLGGFSQAIASVALAGGTLTNGALTGAVTSSGGTIDGLGGSASVTTQAGATTLTGTNSYTGATTVNGGTLVVNGAITASSGLTVAAGATIGGSGQLPSLTVNGTLSPGNSPGTLTVNGNLTLGAGSVYVAEVQGAVSDRINVTGTAALAGTLRIVPLGGAYLFSTPYTLLSAQGGRNGSFGSVDTTGSFGDGVTTGIAYTATDVQLTLTPRPLAPIAGSGQSSNAYAVARGIDRAVAGGANPSALFAIYNLPAAAIPAAAVNQLSGEAHTAAPAMANSAAGQFLHTMLDGSGAGRLAGAAGGPGGAAGFTADLPSRQDGPGRARFDPARFSLWGATFGSTGRTDGDAVAGSASRNLSDAHIAVGADVRLGSNTVAGLAVAGGQSQASLSGGLGKAKADVLQAGLYGRTTLGAVNLAAALGYGRLDTETHRAIPTLGRTGVTASYATQAWSGRIEASLPVMSRSGVTLSPLAAFQLVRASSPAAIERDGTGAGAGMLTLARRSDTTSRSELGVQLDGSMMAGATPVTGFVRAAWAAYHHRDAELTASINGLAGASFSATGARPGRNTALFSAGADIKLSTSVSMGMRVDSEFAANTRRFGGTAQLRVNF
ncbi:autotransporter domain-containing protein [Bosea sp. (in: a-proteobacteria)]|jgi:autotransporter-associated beta strand protein|uniref:autotransporter domain-containing protein n=1 Tax=Bosea sp. (in: a-proteobacteria) TaxID=1871050 RepID=UPI003567E98A